MNKTTLISVIICLSVSAFAGPEAGFAIRLIPAGDFIGKTDEVTGYASMVGNKVIADNIHVNLKSVKTGVELRDKHTQKHLETEKFPEAVLIHAEGQNGTGKGKIKIRGIEKDISGTYKVANNEVQANFKIKLSDFNITGIKYMGIGVDDEVDLNVKVPLKAATAAPVKKTAAAPPKAPSKTPAKAPASRH